jgi:hypothetical protein
MDNQKNTLILIIVFFSITLCCLGCLIILKVRAWLKVDNNKNEAIRQFRAFRVRPLDEV